MYNNKQDLFRIIDNFKGKNILVVGDIILDEYIWGKASRLSPEAPVPVLEVKHKTHVAGGASNVANNICTLGGNAYLCGVLGNDLYFNILKNIFDSNKINSDMIIKDETRPTTVKTRLIAHNNQQLARVDSESRNAISQNTIDRIIEKLEQNISKIDLIICSDYSKGVLQKELIEKIIKLANKNGIKVLVDPKGLDFSKYYGVNYITPNLSEAYGATKSETSRELVDVAKDLMQITGAENVMITLSEDGVYSYDGEDEITMPAVSSEVYDVTGAGDTFLSAFSLAIVSDADIQSALALANYAAGVAVRKVGTTAVTTKQIKEIISSFLDKKEEVEV